MKEYDIFELFKGHTAIYLWHVPTSQMKEIIGITVCAYNRPGVLIEKDNQSWLTLDFLIEKPIPKTEGERILEMLTTELNLSQDLSRPLSSYGLGLSRAVVLVKGFIQKEKSI